ncbi:histidine triad nucleotide-binding protein [Simkania negevensis]|uniref:Histidine triad nucleotide-binding protein n=1 Tax=Simkania negevensis TaxID=83561 RepID=A0ABS3ASP2_9BACT|nr:histidine triad nucleotide-binding protein [Simkania negevensis]
MSNVFQRIIDGGLPCDKVFENDRILAFHDINPVAPVHILIVPKKSIPNIQSANSSDLDLVKEMVEVVQKLASEYEIADGYRLLINNGADAGQTVDHLHFHLIGGRRLGRMA